MGNFGLEPTILIQKEPSCGLMVHLLAMLHGLRINQTTSVTEAKTVLPVASLVGKIRDALLILINVGYYANVITIEHLKLHIEDTH